MTNAPPAAHPSIREEEFDAAFYVAANRDVGKAIEQGIVPSAWEHFQRFGLSERRQWRPIARLAGIDLGEAFEAFKRAGRRTVGRKSGVSS